MKQTLKITVPDEPEIRAALVASIDHQFVEAVLHAEQQLASARQAVDDYDRDRDRLPAAIARGTATLEDLEATLRRREAAALLVPAHQQMLAEAQAALAHAEQAARDSVIARAGEFRNQLQHQADQIAPTLTHLKAIERVLDEIVRAHGATQVHEVTWPAPLITDMQAHNTAMAAGAVATTAAPVSAAPANPIPARW